MNGERILRKCSKCHQTIEMLPSEFARRIHQSKTGKLFCGKACVFSFKTRGRHVLCSRCRRKFWVEPKATQIYCSAVCASLASRVRVRRNCSFCGRGFERKPSEGRPTKFCSGSCFRQHERARKKVVACHECGALHRRKPSEIKGRVFCSMACYRRWTEGRTRATLTKKCERCGQPFLASCKSDKKRKRFCSQKCWLRCKGRTKPEMLVMKALRNLGVKASESRNPLRHFTYPDFVILPEKLCIYVDGEYWHRNQRVKDRLQSKVLRAAGFRVLRIPERSVYKPNLHILLKRVLKRSP